MHAETIWVQTQEPQASAVETDLQILHTECPRRPGSPCSISGGRSAPPGLLSVPLACCGHSPRAARSPRSVTRSPGGPGEPVRVTGPAHALAGVTVSPGGSQAPETCWAPSQTAPSPAVWTENLCTPAAPMQNRQFHVRLTRTDPQTCPFAFIWIEFNSGLTHPGLTWTLTLWLTLGNRPCEGA